jgi:uncharacterized protein (DUF58 family)
MQHSHAMPGARFVDPTVLSRIGNLELLARSVVDGFINGLHDAPFFGASVDFAEHRMYVPGDDVRHVDWRVYARTDKYYVKQYEADTNTNFMVLLDVSRSMSFTTHGVTKLEYGCYLGACLGYLAQRQRDRVGLITFDNAIVEHIPPSAKHFHQVLYALDRAKAERPGNLRQPLTQMAEFFKRRGILALISDLYDDPDAILEAVRPFRMLGNDLMIFHVLDPAEIDFTFDEASAFEDMESGEQIPVVPKSFARQYRQLIQEHVEALTTRCAENRIDYALLSTANPLDEALFRYLASRERFARVR